MMCVGVMMSVVGRILPQPSKMPSPNGYIRLHDKRDFAFIIEITNQIGRLSRIIWVDPISYVLLKTEKNKQKSKSE